MASGVRCPRCKKMCGREEATDDQGKPCINYVCQTRDMGNGEPCPNFEKTVQQNPDWKARKDQGWT